MVLPELSLNLFLAVSIPSVPTPFLVLCSLLDSFFEEERTAAPPWSLKIREENAFSGCIFPAPLFFSPDDFSPPDEEVALPRATLLLSP